MTVSIIENFLSEKDCLSISNYLDGITKANDQPHYLVALGFPTSNEASAVSLDNPIKLSDHDEPTNIAMLVTKAILMLRSKMEEEFNEKLALVNCNYVQMLEGASNPLHADRTHLDGTPYHDGEELEFSALIYFNDCEKDYTGGEIEFPIEDITITPKTGMAIFFKGDIQHQHEVKKVLSGVRKNMVLFFAKHGNTSDRMFFNDEHSGVNVWVSIRDDAGDMVY